MATTPTVDPVTGKPYDPGILTAAEQAAQAEIQGQVSPLQAREKTLGAQETSAREAIGKEFAGLMPFVAGSGARVGAAYQGALSMEQQIFQAAGSRMNALHQQQAKEAQDLAQQMGGPVSTGQFTQAMEPYETALASAGPAAMLDTLGRGLAGVQHAEAFAGQVFPALQTEQQAHSDDFYKNQIKDIQAQIDAALAGKSSLTQAKLQDLLNQKRAYDQQQYQNQRDRLKDKRDWKVQQQQIRASKLSGKLSQGAAKRAGVQLGLSKRASRRADIQLQASIAHMSRADKLAAERLGLSKAEFMQRVQQQKQSAKQGSAKVSDSIQKDAISLIQAAMGSGKPVSRTYRAYIPGAAGHVKGLKPPAGAYWDPKKGQYYRIGHETMTANEWKQQTGEGGTAITDPNRLYDYMRGSLPQLGRKATINLIRAQTGHKNWSPGKQMTYTGHDLQVMPLSELRGIARDFGFPHVGGAKTTRQMLVDYVLGRIHTPHPGHNP